MWMTVGCGDVARAPAMVETSCTTRGPCETTSTMPSFTSNRQKSTPSSSEGTTFAARSHESTSSAEKQRAEPGPPERPALGAEAEVRQE